MHATPLTHSDYTIKPVASSRPSISIEGGKWEIELHDAVDPLCDYNVEPVSYASKTSTGFVSFPRSGNSEEHSNCWIDHF